MEKMRELHTRCTHLFLLDEPIVYDGKRKWTCLITFILLQAMRMGRIITKAAYERPLVMKENGICDLMEDEERHQFYGFSSFFRGRSSMGFWPVTLTRRISRSSM